MKKVFKMKWTALLTLTLGLALLIGCGAGNTETKPASTPAVAQLPQNSAKSKVDDALLQKLQGEWLADSMVANGKTVVSQGKNANQKNADLLDAVFQGPTMYSKSGNKLVSPLKIVYLALEGGLIHMDTVGDLGDGKEKTMKWLAKADDNYLSICVLPGQNERPAALESKPGTNTLMSGYKRKKN